MVPARPCPRCPHGGPAGGAAAAAGSAAPVAAAALHPAHSLTLILILPRPTPRSPHSRFELLALLCPNSTGADIRSVATEAGMYAIRARRKTVTEKDFLDAVNKVGGRGCVGWDGQRRPVRLQQQPLLPPRLLLRRQVRVYLVVLLPCLCASLPRRITGCAAPLPLPHRTACR